MVKKREDMDVLDEVVGTSILASAEVLIQPLTDRDYYLYTRADGSAFVSLVEPQYWHTDRFNVKYVMTAVYSANGTWKEKGT